MNENMLDRKIPFSLEAEQSLIGSMLASPELIDVVSEIVTPEDFYESDHRDMFITLQSMHNKSKSIDVVTFMNELVKIGTFSNRNSAEKYVRNIAEILPTATNARDYAKIVKDKAILRAIVEAGENIAEAAYTGEDEAETLIEYAEEMVYRIAEQKQHINTGFVTAPQGLRKVREWLKTKGNNGLKTGLSDLDKILGGIEPTDYCVIGARPSAGKTALGLRIALEVAKQKPNETVLFYSMEMPDEQIWRRLAGIESRMNLKRLKELEDKDEHNRTEDEKKEYKNRYELLAMAESIICDCNIETKDEKYVTPNIIKQDIRRHKNKIAMIVIDYVQLMDTIPHIKDDTERTSVISRELRKISLTCNIPIIALAQLNRGGTERKPMMQDLKETGQLEQDADKIIMIDAALKTKRPLNEAYDIGGKKWVEQLLFKSVTDNQTGYTTDRLVLRVVKNRAGAQGDAIVQYTNECMRFENLDLNLFKQGV